METCDAVIVGGGPAGSSCAWRLRRSGLDVIVMDAKQFPRDKVCAGWITPQVVTSLQLDAGAYSNGRTFQPITGFRVGLIDGAHEVEVSYGAPVSFGIRRCEFDDYLLQRSTARLRLGVPISRIRRDGDTWVVNEAVRAPILIGAGGHFCPVARMLNGRPDALETVAAQEVEMLLERRDDHSFATGGETPELYFSRDLKGYGWCFRKGDYVNIGFGRLGGGVPKASAGFVAFLKARHRVPTSASWRWSGHAYLLSQAPCRRIVGDSIMLVGDAAGLAYPQSGEGIRPAVESGLLAARAIVEANGRYTRDRLAAYEQQLRQRFGRGPVSRLISRTVPAGLPAVLAPWLFQRSWFVRHQVLDRGFLHASQPALV